MRKTLLLWAGVAAAALYVAIVDIGAELTPGYSHISQPVSSLYQSGAVLALPIAAAFVVYNMLVALCGAGVVPAYCDPHDPGREVEEAREPLEVGLPRCRRVAPGEKVERRSMDGRPGRRKLACPRAVGIDLSVGRKRRAVIGGEVLPYQRMVGRRRPLVIRGARVGAQAVIQPRGVAGSRAAESLIPVRERFALTKSASGLTGSLTR